MNDESRQSLYWTGGAIAAVLAIVLVLYYSGMLTATGVE